MSGFGKRPAPAWYWIVAVILLLWESMGFWSWYEHHTKGPAGMGNVPTEWDIAYFAALPGWYTWLFLLAVGTGLLTGILLLLRKSMAVGMATLSLIATITMFAYTFLGTNMLEKGMWTAYFPAFIIVMGFVTVWFARKARANGWLG